MPTVLAYPLEVRDNEIHGRCPECGKTFVFNSISTIEEAEGSTTDCNNCNALLLIKNQKVWEFHKTLHAEDSRWPKDGAGTAYVEV